MISGVIPRLDIILRVILVTVVVCIGDSSCRLVALLDDEGATIELICEVITTLGSLAHGMCRHTSTVRVYMYWLVVAV